MHTKDVKTGRLAQGGRPLIPPKNTVDLTTNAGRERVLQAARKVITEHNAVIKALAKR